MGDTGLSEDEAWECWKKGWDSAVSVAEDALKEMMQNSYRNPDNLAVYMPEENFHRLKGKIADGLWASMRIAQKGGLDYYFAASAPRTILGGKPL